MRILHVINSLATGGAEKLILETVPKYNAQGVQADVLLLNGSDFPFLQELSKQNCCKIYSFGTGSPYHVKFILKLIPCLRKYDLIHAHLFPANYFVAVAKLLSLSRTPVIFTEHSTSNRRFRQRNLRWINSFVYKIFTKIVTITQEVQANVLKFTKVPVEKLEVINSGIDVRKYSDAEVLPLRHVGETLTVGDFLLMQVSSFRMPKDHHTIVKSLPYLPPHVKLILTGEGPLKEGVQILVNQLGLKDRVFFLGVRTDIPALLKTAHINILSSHYEGLSLASMEGMASGRPFIASDVPGLSEVVGGHGVLFPQGDAKKLASEIIKLMDDQNYYQEVGARCAARARGFGIEEMVQKHIALYRSLTKD